MQSDRFTRVGRLVAALLAVFAFGAIAATAAQAEEAPHWVVEGNKLETNKTREITIKAFEGTAHPLILGSELLGVKVTIECHLAKAAKGAFLAGGEPGTGELSSEYSDCAQTGNGSSCKAEEPIKVNPVRFEIVVNTKLTTYLVEFDQAKTETFVTLKFTGTCLVNETPVKGLVAGSLCTDPTVTGKAEEEAYKETPEYSSFLVRFPDPATKIWLWKGGVHEEHTITPLTFDGEPAKLEGAGLVLLARNGVSTGENYGIRG
jgi:hypothetical protein